MGWVILKELPEDHPLRNTPLIQIQAENQTKDSKIWYEIRPAFKISNKTYNELGPAWTEYDMWRGWEEDWNENRIDIIGQNGNTGEHY